METEDRVIALAIVIGGLLFAFGCWFLERGAATTAVAPRSTAVKYDPSYSATTTTSSTTTSTVAAPPSTHATTTTTSTTTTTAPAAQWITSMGSTHGCAARANVVLCRGSNLHGELGGSTAGTRGEVTQTFDAPITDVQAGDYDTCALSGGRVYCWGWRTVGNGVDPGDAFGAVDKGLSNVTALSVGPGQTCAATDNGLRSAIYCWGDGWTAAGYDGAHFTNTPTQVWEGRHVHELVTEYRTAKAHVGFDDGGCGWIAWGQGFGVGGVARV